MATLTNNTVGSLRKMWPPVKKKAIDAHLSFGKFLGSASATNPTAPAADGKPAGAASKAKKRKTTDENPETADSDDKKPDSAADKSDGKIASDNSTSKKAKVEKKAPAPKKPRAKTQVKKEEPASDNDAENSADGGDGLGEYCYTDNMHRWLNSTDE